MILCPMMNFRTNALVAFFFLTFATGVLADDTPATGVHPQDPAAAVTTEGASSDGSTSAPASGVETSTAEAIAPVDPSENNAPGVVEPVLEDDVLPSTEPGEPTKARAPRGEPADETEGSFLSDYSPLIVGSSGAVVLGIAAIVSLAAGIGAGAISATTSQGTVGAGGAPDALASALALTVAGTVFLSTGFTGAAIAGLISTAISLFMNDSGGQTLWTLVGAAPGMAMGLLASGVGVFSGLAALASAFGGSSPGSEVYGIVFLSSLGVGILAPVIAGAGAGVGNYFARPEEE